MVGFSEHLNVPTQDLIHAMIGCRSYFMKLAYFFDSLKFDGRGRLLQQPPTAKWLRLVSTRLSSIREDFWCNHRYALQRFGCLHRTIVDGSLHRR